jgi:hypothetical protein
MQGVAVLMTLENVTGDQVLIFLAATAPVKWISIYRLRTLHVWLTQIQKEGNLEQCCFKRKTKQITFV